MTDAIEPWVSDETHRKVLLQLTADLRQEQLHRSELHRADLHRLDLAAAAQTAQTARATPAPARHASVSAQHIDVDV